jgi:hypothetical protein
MSNVKRVKDYEDALELKQAFTVWRNKFEDWGQQIRSDIKSRTREVPGKLAVPERDVKIMLESMTPFWNFESELLRVPLRHYDPKLEQWWPKSAIFQLYGKEVGRWAQRARKKALDAWKWLDRVSEWADSWHGGSDPIRIKTKSVENASIEGFKVQLVGFEPGEDSDHTIARLHAGLKLYREKAKKVLPWLISNQLPIEIQADFSAIQTGAASYHYDHIEVTPWGAKVPLEFTHEMAHEMAHHLFKHLSGEAVEEWSLFIKGGKVQIDLKDLVQEISARPDEELYNVEDRLKVENPILALQLGGLIHDPAYRDLDLYSIRSIHEYIESGKDTRFTVSSKPITGYAQKNSEEAFCEAVGYSVAYGPQTVLPEVRAMLRTIVPSIRIASLSERIVDRFLSEDGTVLRVAAERVAARYMVLAKYTEKKEVPKANGSGKTTVYVYSDKAVSKRNKSKAERLEKLRNNIHKLTTQVKKDLKSKDPETCLTALAVACIWDTSERVGNEESAKGEKNDSGEPHHGVTTWKKSHLKFKGGKAILSYVGKSAVKQRKEISDKAIVTALRAAYDSCTDDALFCYDGGKISAPKVNTYLEKFSITAKDLRGLKANEEVIKALKAARSKGGKLPTDPKKRATKLKEEFDEAVGTAASLLGNEVKTLASQYLVPGLEDQFKEDGTILEKMTDG